MSFCSNCGHELVPEDQFCSKCGRSSVPERGVRLPTAIPSTLNLQVDPGLIAAAAAAAAAFVVGYVVSLIFYKAAVAAIAGNLAIAGPDAQFVKSLLSGIAGKSAGISLYMAHQIKVVADGGMSFAGMSSSASADLAMPITLFVLVPILSIAAAAFVACRWRPVSGRREILMRAAQIGVAYTVIMLIAKPLFTLSTGDIKIPDIGMLGGMGGSLHIMPSFLSTLVHSLAFGLVFGALGTWLALNSEDWRSSLMSWVRNEDGMIPSWLHGVAVAFVSAQVILLVIALIAGIGAIETHQKDLTSAGISRPAAYLGVLNYSPYTAGTAYYLLIGAPIHANVAMDMPAFGLMGGGGSERMTAYVGLLSGAGESDSSNPGRPPEKTALPGYLYLAALIPIACLVAGGWLAARGNSGRYDQNSLCLRFAGAHAGLLVLLLPAFRMVFHMKGSGGAGDFQGQMMSTFVSVGPGLFGTIVAGLVVGFGASWLGVFLHNRGQALEPAAVGCYCTHCGTANEPDSAFCTQCGEKL